MASGIYAIVSPSGRTYVGSSTDIERRRKTHFRDLRQGRHANQILQRAFAKYGKSGLKFLIVELCDREFLLQREQIYIEAVAPDQRMNIATQAVGGSGPKSATTRRKISERHTGRKHSAESRANMSQAHKGKVQDAVSRQRKAIANFARPYKSASPFRCVAFDSRHGKWFAYATIDGQRLYVPGRFLTAEAANNARSHFLEIRHGG